MSRKGIWEIYDILDSNTNTFYEYEKLIESFNLKVDFVTYIGLIAAIPGKWENMLKLLTPEILDVEIEMYYDIISSTKQNFVSALAYNKLKGNSETL